MQAFSNKEFLTYQGGGDVVAAGEKENYSQLWYLKSLSGEKNTVSFKPEASPGFYLVSENGELTVSKHNGTDSFIANATFKQVEGLANSDWSSYHLVDKPEVYLVLHEGSLKLSKASSDIEKEAATFRPSAP